MRDLCRAYLAGEAGAFYAGHPADAGARARAVGRARPVDARVLPVLRGSQGGIDALARGAAAVVTGQQVGLFLGPLYTLHKAASAVVLARRLSAETATPVVPVFWLQTEDHDVAEIAWCGLPGRKVELAVDAHNKVSIAHLRLPAMDAVLAQVADALGEGEHAGEHLARLARHYREGATWGDAFAGVLAELFDDLVLIDPRDPALAGLALPVHERAIAQAGPIAAALEERVRALEAAGFSAPVHVRPGAPLCFFHPEGAEGPRVRLDTAGEVADARCLSTSALLRPILQDTLLPTAAYVGGPTEVAYFAQLGPLYAAYGMEPPLVVHRARFLVVDGRTRRLLARLGMTTADMSRPEEELLLREPDRDVAGEMLAAYLEAHDRLAPLVEKEGPGIPRALARTRASVTHAVAKLGGKLARAAAYRDAERVTALRQAQAVIAPAGVPQERWLGLPWLAARVGDRELVAALLAAVDPYDPSLKELHP